MGTRGNFSFHRYSRTIKLIVSSGISQALVGIFAFLRIPILLENSPITVAAALFFYFGILAWYPFLIAADVNLSRISTVTTGKPKILLSEFGQKKYILLAVLFITGIILCNILNSNLMAQLVLIGLPNLLLFYLINKRLAWTLGFAQGSGKQIFLSAQSGLGAFFSLVAIFLLTRISLWQELIPQLQFELLFLVTSIGNSVPMIGAKISASRNRITPLGEIIQYQKKWSETLSTFPPALITGFDTVALLIFSSEKELINYGIYSRLILIVALVPSALQIEIVNRTNSILIDESQNWKSFFLPILNIPAIALVMIFHSKILNFLSNTEIYSNTIVIVLICTYGFILFPWTVIYSRMLARDRARMWFGKKVMKIIVPLTLISVSLLSLLFGFVGPFLSLNLVYITASYYGFKAVRLYHSKNV